MKLSAGIFIWELSKSFELVVSDSMDKRQRNLKYALLASDRDFEADTVYVTENAAELSGCAFPETSLLISLVPEDKKGDAVKIHAPYIFVKADSFVTLFNAVQAVFSKYNTWEEEMAAIMTSQKKVAVRLMDCAARYLNNILCFQDYCFVARIVSFQGEKYKGANWNSAEVLMSLLNKPAPKTTIDYVKYVFPERKKVRQAQYHGDTAHETIDYPLFDGDSYIGMLSMLRYNRPFAECDFELMEVFGEYMAFALSHYEDDDGEKLRGLNDAFSDLLEHKHVSKEHLESLCFAAGYDMNDSYLCVSLAMSSRGKSFAEYIKSTFRAMNAPPLICEKGDKIVLLVNTSKNGLPGACSWYEPMLNTLKNFELSAYISDSFNALKHCELYYRQTEIMADSIPKPQPGSVYFFKNYRYDYVLKSSVGQLIPEQIYTDGFKRLLEYNNTVNVDHINTLCVFLEENLNAASAARRMFISRNTFLARYERICEIMQEDLKDPTQRFLVELSVRLYLHQHVNK